MNATFSCFVTGTDTEVGKTLISSALLYGLAERGWRAAGMKPVAAGATERNHAWCNDDVLSLAAASNVQLPQALANPYLLKDAIAPHIAAANEAISIDLMHIADCLTRIQQLTNAVVVEGIGGFRVPLTDLLDTADLAVRLDLPVILVVGMRLGCLNHTLLTAEAIARRGLRLVGWVANEPGPTMPYRDANIAALKSRLGVPLLGQVPYLALASAVNAAAHLDFTQLANWPTTGPN